MSRYITEVILKMCAVTLDLPHQHIDIYSLCLENATKQAPTQSWLFQWPSQRQPPRTKAFHFTGWLFPGPIQSSLLLFSHLANLAGNKTEEMLMPIPVFNVINGGSHAGNKLAMQEFMLFPFGAETFSQAMKMGSETYHHLKVRCLNASNCSLDY